jgi:hypothetical protein
VKQTVWITAENKYVPGAGDVPELVKDAFAAKSPIVPADGGKAKKYTSSAGTVVAVVTQVQKPDMAKYDSARGDLIRQLAGKKQRELYEDWLKKLSAKAKIDINPDVVKADVES